MSQQGYGLGGVFRSAGRYVSPILGEVGKIGATVGADLAKNLLSDVIDGKNVKEAARERGRQAGKQSLNLAGEKAIQAIQSPKTPTYTTPRLRNVRDHNRRALTKNKKAKSLRKEEDVNEKSLRKEGVNEKSHNPEESVKKQKEEKKLWVLCFREQ